MTNEAERLAMRPKLPVPTAQAEAPYVLAWALCSNVKPKVRYLSSLQEAGEGQLRPGELWLWVGEAVDTQTDLLDDLQQVLDQATLKRLQRLASQHRTSVGIAHASARLLLSAILDHPPRELSFGYGPFGKPYLLVPQASPEEGLHFNLSHTDGAVAVALARNPVGVDIEIQRDQPDFLEIAETVFAPETVAAVAGAASGAQRRSIFYRHWTLGEALIKATGGGVFHDLKSFAFTSQAQPELCRADGEFSVAKDWAFGIHGVGKADAPLT